MLINYSVINLCDCNLEINLQLMGISSGDLTINWSSCYPSRCLNVEAAPVSLLCECRSGSETDAAVWSGRKGGWHTMVVCVSLQLPVHLSESLSPLMLLKNMPKSGEGKNNSTSWTFSFLCSGSSTSASLQNKKSDQCFCLFDSSLQVSDTSRHQKYIYTCVCIQCLSRYV